MALREVEAVFGEFKKRVKQLYEKIKRVHYCLVCIIVIGTAVTLFDCTSILASNSIWNPFQDLAEMETLSCTLAQILGGVAVGIGIYFAWGNLQLPEKARITERFN